MPKTIAELTVFMDQLTKALDALAEGVNVVAEDEASELLAQFNELVPECDARLHVCAGLLAKGLRDEALGYEADDPALLETVTLLDLSSRPKWNRWLDSLKTLGFPEPAMPKIEVAVELRQAQEQVVALRPLLSQWRRENLANAPLASRIATLRRLRAEDPNNETWFECLKAHENQRFMELEAEVKEALATTDEQRLSRLVEEMKAQWIESPPQRVRNAAKKGLDSFRDARLDSELDQTADALATAMEARDLEAARDIKGRWIRLVSEKGAFTENDPRLEKASPVVTWIESHDRLESLFSEVWNALDARPTVARARREWVRGLTRMRDEVEDLAEKLRDEIDIEPIERLRARVARVEEEHRREQASNRLLVYLTVAAIATVVIGSVATFVSLSRHNDRVKSAIAELDSLRQRVERGEFEPDKIPRPKLSDSIGQDPAVDAKAQLLDAAVAKERDRRDRFAQLQSGLDGMLDSLAKSERLTALEAWPDPFVEATKTLAAIQTGAFAKTASDKAVIEKDAGLLENTARRFRRDGDEALAHRTNELSRRLETVQEQMRGSEQDAIAALEGIEKDVTALRSLLAQPAAAGAAGSFADSRKTSRNTAQPLDADGAISKAIAAARKGIGDQQRSKDGEQAIDAAIGDWPRYAEQLAATAADFPQQAISRDYSEAAKDLPLWMAVAEWNEFAKSLESYELLSTERAQAVVDNLVTLRESAGKLSFVQQFIDDNEPLAQSLAKRDLAEVRNAFAEWLDREWLGELAWCVKTADKVYYCLEKPANTNEFEYQKQMKRAGMKDWPPPERVEEQWDVVVSPQKQLADELEGACIAKFPDNARGVALEEVLVDAIARTLAAGKVEPCLRLVTLRKLVLLGHGVSPAFHAPEMDALRKELDDRMGGIPGIETTELGEFLEPSREQNRGYVKVRKISERVLEQAKRVVEPLKKTVAGMRHILSHKDVRTMLCVGRLARDQSGAIVLAPLTNVVMPTNAKLIVIGPNGEVTKIGACGPDGRANIEKGTRVAGVPVFAWQERGGK